MVLIAQPNLISALRSHLLTFPEITSLVSSPAGWTDGRTEPRVASQIHDRWVMPTRAITLRLTGGPTDENDASMGLETARVDVQCYGSHPHEAQGLINLVVPALQPLQRTPAGFTQGPCRIGSITREAAVIVDVNPTTGWPFAWVPMIVRWLGVPV